MEHQSEFESLVLDYYQKEIAPDVKSSKSSKSKKSSSRSGSLQEERKDSGGTVEKMKSNSNSNSNKSISNDDKVSSE